MQDLISRQAAIDALKDATFDFEACKIVLEQLPPAQPEPPEECERCMMEHTDEMEKLEAELAMAEPHWIPVTEDTLPEENRVVVVCGNKGTWDFGTYRGHGNDIHFWNWKKNTIKRVYWWMYKEDALPEPYKGVTE